MRHVATMLGIENQTHVTLTEINATCRIGRQFKTEVITIQSVGINTSKIQQIETLLITLQQKHHKMQDSELIRYLDHALYQIEKQPPL